MINEPHEINRCVFLTICNYLYFDNCKTEISLWRILCIFCTDHLHNGNRELIMGLSDSIHLDTIPCHSYHRHTHKERTTSFSKYAKNASNLVAHSFFLHTGKHSVLHLKRLAIFERCEKKYRCKIFLLIHSVYLYHKKLAGV